MKKTWFLIAGIVLGAPWHVAAEPNKTADPVAVSTAAPSLAGLNEMKGKLESKSSDSKTLRLSVDGGFNVEFTYDAKTIVANEGHAIALDDLDYNDELVIHYSGKELYAIQIDRTGKAPRPQ